MTGQPAQFDVVQRVIDFTSGSGTPLHTHSGPQFAVVLAGDLAYRIYGKDDTYKPGKAWMEPTNVAHTGGNHGTTTARIMTTALLAPGAVYATTVETPAAMPVTGGAPLRIAWLVAGWAALGLGLGLKGYRLRHR